MVTRAHCTRFIGRHVVFRTNDGIHHGILHSMTDDGIVVRPVGSRTTRLANTMAESPNAILLQDCPATENDLSEVWFPFFFFPFFALWWLWPWGWYW